MLTSMVTHAYESPRFKLGSVPCFQLLPAMAFAQNLCTQTARVPRQPWLQELEEWHSCMRHMPNSPWPRTAGAALRGGRWRGRAAAERCTRQWAPGCAGRGHGGGEGVHAIHIEGQPQHFLWCCLLRSTHARKQGCCKCVACTVHMLLCAAAAATAAAADKKRVAYDNPCTRMPTCSPNAQQHSAAILTCDPRLRFSHNSCMRRSQLRWDTCTVAHMHT